MNQVEGGNTPAIAHRYVVKKIGAGGGEPDTENSVD
jgi:hypothetical protein